MSGCPSPLEETTYTRQVNPGVQKKIQIDKIRVVFINFGIWDALPSDLLT